ncbi:F0F1 ATP synthase subunit delta [Mycetocola manganoxydans]|jgi:F-type H+-transporting ATPase subunit delta|uniref:ATP synthase subunit delta n=1 Tax=Mycetocola manganoxydans TaxID=699879 RepID=A0A3L7A1C3_9MICO|nr:F0F1 ATP synthase subunit delta [Mycetocola manganoxydans]RLP73765.1 F0F1 ATP synthase subunit delta [Mycetocola manganoxydans]GHD43190.1 ATP synthase subunit delta [Mycetocola manganoxydans]
MGSATRGAVTSARNVLAGLPSVDLASAQGLFGAAATIAGSMQLRSLLTDSGRSVEEKSRMVTSLFGSRLSESALHLVIAAVSARWSSQDDLVAGIEQLALRAAAASAPADVDVAGELFAFGSVIQSDSELEFALGSRAGAKEAKVALVERLLRGRASDQTILIVEHFVRTPGSRNIGESIDYARSVAADQSGFAVATVQSAHELTAAQVERLERALSGKYDRAVRVNQVINPDVIGGFRIQVDNDVIDGSVASRINDLRLQLAS